VWKISPKRTIPINSKSSEDEKKNPLAIKNSPIEEKQDKKNERGEWNVL